MASTAFLQAADGMDAKPPTIIDSLTGNAAAGTRSTHAHGLAYTPRVVLPVPIEAAADAALTGGVGIAVVSITATNVVVRCEKASQTFSLICFP